MTFASACNRFLRMQCLYSKTLATEPSTGCCRRRVHQSQVAYEWLAWMEHQLISYGADRISHGRNGGEVRIPGTRYTADGFDCTTTIVYEFDGCYCCLNCYPFTAVLTVTLKAPKRIFIWLTTVWTVCMQCD